MPANILAIGTALPETSISQKESCELAKHLCCDNDVQRRTLEFIFRRSTIQRRFSDLLSEQLQAGTLPLFYAPRRTMLDTG
ncbi:MAG: hypothetical protein ACRD3W_31875, partial [Terriglobales bacterium]